MTRLGPALVLFAACLVAVPDAGAAKVKVWHQYTPAHFDKAKLQQAVVTSDGVVRLSRQFKQLAGLNVANVWAVVEDPKGNLYAATGDEGKIFKVTDQGAEVVYASKDSQVLSLALGADGVVYAGTGPTGKIIRLQDGKGQVVAEKLGSYVWSLAYDPASNRLFAGTGPKGKIYRVDPKGKADVFYDAKQDHILTLALGPKGTLYAGTDKGGLVYRIDQAGKGFVLFHAHQNEVRSLLVTPEAVYAGTSAPVGRKATGFSGGSKPSGPTGEEIRPTPPSNAAPAGGDNSVYRLAPDGTVRELFRDKTLMLSLLGQKGRLLVGTGMQGQLFEIDPKGRERAEIARLANGQIHSLVRRRDGAVVLGTGDPGKLYALQDQFVARGTVLSDVLDAKLLSRWGALTWKAQTPPGTAVSVAARSGNVAEPDETWSAWSAEQTDPLAAKADVPPARYFQYRVTLTTKDPGQTPEFRNFTLRYQPTNQAPEITSVDVPDLDAGNLENPKKLKVKWSATDPNDDNLNYAIYVRKEGWNDWVLLEEHHEKKDFEWDTTGVPSGVYRVKVVASDRPHNPPEDAFTAERVSPPVPISHLPPNVTLKLVGVENGRAKLEAAASDPYVRLAEASFAVNGKRWTSVFPTDGLFDSNAETFRFTTEPLRPGAYVVLLRVRNAAGSYGSADAVFTVREGNK